MNTVVRSVEAAKPDIARSEVRDGMRIDWDLPVVMDDGLVLRADVFRPIAEGRYPVILSYGPYAKGLAFQDGYSTCWEKMVTQHPDVASGSSSKYQNWEVVDPEKWVPHGYACVRVDSRGAGRSPGYLTPFCMRETQDIYHCIEWAAAQHWSTGKIGMNGISYYAVNQWLVAALEPPHLSAMCIWEGLSDSYRDANYHGGIMQTMPRNWWDMQIMHVQHGYGTRGFRSRVTGELVAGPETLSDEELSANRERYGEDLAAHPFDDAFHRERTAQFDKIKVPFLSAGNWGGQGLHTRGNVEGFVRSASKQKWLEMHGLEHWTEFYTDYGVNLQRRFFDHFLKGEDNGWDKQPPIMLRVRHIDRFEDRTETEWPMARTQWTKFYLDPDGLRLTTMPPRGNRTITYAPLRDGVTFLSDPLETATEITGQSACKLFISCATEDADIFLVLRVFAPDMKEIVFVGALDPHTPVQQGWLRASHRELDPALSKPYRPYHTHQRKLPLKPGERTELDIEILPTSVVVPAGYRIGLSVRGRDYVYPGASGGRLSNMKNEFTGCGPFLHNDGDDRPPAIFGGDVTIHMGADAPSHVLLPVVPAK
jgi:uncharacterized protein